MLKSASIPTFSSDSQYIFYGLTDASVAVWSANTGEHITNFVGHVGQPRCLAFNPKKALFASGKFFLTSKVPFNAHTFSFILLACVNLIWWQPKLDIN